MLAAGFPKVLLIGREAAASSQSGRGRDITESENGLRCLVGVAQSGFLEDVLSTSL